MNLKHYLEIFVGTVASIIVLNLIFSFLPSVKSAYTSLPGTGNL